MDQSATQHSTKFPPEYGDFALHCSDGVVCHFPRHLLAYMSPVFEDMFSLAKEPTDPDSTNESFPPSLKLQESSIIIEALLEHVDPKSKRSLPIDPDVILKLLEAARKYQVSTVTEWFIEQAGLPRVGGSPVDMEILDPFTSTNPQLALECAMRFEFPLIGRLALRQLVASPVSTTLLQNDDLSLCVYKHICQLREDRIERYRGYLSQLSKGVKEVLYENGQFCGRCAGAIGEWFLCMERAVVDKPKWESFLDAFKSLKACGYNRCYREPLSQRLEHYINKWKDKAIELEEELPGWPVRN